MKKNLPSGGKFSIVSLQNELALTLRGYETPSGSCCIWFALMRLKHSLKRPIRVLDPTAWFIQTLSLKYFNLPYFSTSFFLLPKYLLASRLRVLRSCPKQPILLMREISARFQFLLSWREHSSGCSWPGSPLLNSLTPSKGPLFQWMSVL